MTTHPAEQVRFELLGGFRVLVGGRDVEAAWPGRRSVELVQLLSLADRHHLVRDQVIEALWPHLPPEAGAANLRKAAHHARRALNRDDAVVLSGSRVALFPSCWVETDVEWFERGAEAALRSQNRGACAEVASTYTGVLLPESLYQEWTQGRRDRLRSQYVELLRFSGQWERLAEVEPSDEQAHRELMSAALAGGNRHAAIRWYGRLRMNLERELGVAPSPESQALYGECVAGLGRSATPFVGRQVELATATVALRTAEKGEVSALIVRGPAGIGKSALCRQVASFAKERAWLVVTVDATAGNSPYAPLVQAVEQLLSRDRSLLDTLPDQARSTLEKLTLLTAPALPNEVGLTRHRVIGALLRLLVACGDAVGVMLIVDDAHLADEATADVCVHLARAGGGLPFLAVLAYRPEVAGNTLTLGVAGLARAGRSVEIDLGPLGDDDIALLAQAASSTSSDDGVLAQIVGTAQGSPFFALELARGVVPGEPLEVAPSVWDAVTARFLDLDDGSAGLLRLLAVAGDDLDPGEVLALTGLPEPNAYALLDAALEAGALIVSGARYRFRHDLVRQALVEQVPPHHRIAMHRRAAVCLAGYGAAPALIAGHWLDGGRLDEATRWLLAAARHAIKLGAFADALGQLQRLLDHEPNHPEALLLQAEGLDALGDSRAPAAYAAAARVAGEPASHEIKAKQALAQLKLGDPPGALRTVEGIEPVTVEGRLAEALTWSGAAALGFADPELGTIKAAECRRLASGLGGRLGARRRLLGAGSGRACARRSAEQRSNRPARDARAAGAGD